MALGGAVAQADQPFRGVAQMVGALLLRLGGDRGERRVGRAHHRAPIRVGEGGVEELPHDGVRRNRRSAARPAAGCGIAARRADRRAGPRRARRPRARRHRRRASAPGRSGRAPILASASSSSSIGACPVHSRQAVAEDQRVVGAAQRVEHQRASRRRVIDVVAITCARRRPAPRRRSGGGRSCRRRARTAWPCRPGRWR